MVRWLGLLFIMCIGTQSLLFPMAKATSTGAQGHVPAVIILSEQELKALEYTLKVIQTRDAPLLLRFATLRWQFQSRLFVYSDAPTNDQSAATPNKVYVIVFDQDSQGINLNVLIPGLVSESQPKPILLPGYSANSCGSTTGYLCALSAETDHNQVTVKTYEINIPAAVVDDYRDVTPETDNPFITATVSDMSSHPVTVGRQLIFRQPTSAEPSQVPAQMWSEQGICELDSNGQTKDLRTLLQSTASGRCIT